VQKSELTWHGLSEVPQDWAGCVVTIGVFDGFHRGHQALVRRARGRARRLGLPLVLMTFDPHPRSVTSPDLAPVMLLTVHERVSLAHALGVDVVLVVPFTPAFAAVSAEEFVEQTLIGSLKARAIVIGSSFRFGARGRGDSLMLKAMSPLGGFEVEVVDPVAIGGRTCSSTELRRCLAEGDARGTFEILGRHQLRHAAGLVLMGRHA